MKEDNHIDPDVFQLLIESGVWMEYANKYVDPSQIDEVNLEKIPGYDTAAAEKRNEEDTDHNIQKFEQVS